MTTKGKRTFYITERQFEVLKRNHLREVKGYFSTLNTTVDAIVKQAKEDHNARFKEEDRDRLFKFLTYLDELPEIIPIWATARLEDNDIPDDPFEDMWFFSQDGALDMAGSINTNVLMQSTCKKSNIDWASTVVSGLIAGYEHPGCGYLELYILNPREIGVIHATDLEIGLNEDTTYVQCAKPNGGWENSGVANSKSEYLEYNGIRGYYRSSDHWDKIFIRDYLVQTGDYKGKYFTIIIQQMHRIGEHYINNLEPNIDKQSFINLLTKHEGELLYSKDYTKIEPTQQTIFIKYYLVNRSDEMNKPFSPINGGDINTRLTHINNWVQNSKITLPNGWNGMSINQKERYLLKNTGVPANGWDELRKLLSVCRCGKKATPSPRPT
jgi:hypothetical protein